MLDRLMRSHGRFAFMLAATVAIQANKVVRLCHQAVTLTTAATSGYCEQAGMFDEFLNQGIRRVKAAITLCPPTPG